MIPADDGGLDVTWNYQPGIGEQIVTGLASLNNSATWRSAAILAALLLVSTLLYRRFGHTLREGYRPQDRGTFLQSWPNARALPLISGAVVLLLFGISLAFGAANAVDYERTKNFQQTVRQTLAEKGFHVNYWEVPAPEQSSAQVSFGRSQLSQGASCVMENRASGSVHRISVRCADQIVYLS